MHALCDGCRHTLGGDEQRRQTGCRLFGALPNAGGGYRIGFRLAPGQSYAKGAHKRSMTSSNVTPSARAAKLSAMRWRRTGFASASTSSMDGA